MRARDCWWPHCWQLLPALVVAALAAVPYAGTLRAGWTYDDKVAVQGNPDVTRLEVPLAELWAHDFWGNELGARAQGGWTHFSWRPLVTLSFRADFLRAGGILDAPTFHATNVAIHVAACLAMLWALRAVAGPRRAGRALLAAGLFALHPIHTECVANVTSRSDALAAVFQGVAIALHAGGPGVEAPGARTSSAHAPTPAAVTTASTAPRLLRLLLRGVRPSRGGALRFVGVLACLAAALLCKETALVTPVLLVALDVLRALGRALLRARTRDDSDHRCQHRERDAQRGAPRAAAACGGSAASPAAPLASWDAAPPLAPTGASSHRRSLVALARELLDSGCAARCAAYACVAGASYVGRVLVMARGYDLARFANEIHNPFKQLADPLARALSVPFVQAFALSQLLLPVTLQHEHQAMRLVYTLRDPRNAFTAGVLCAYAAVALLAARRLFAVPRACAPPPPPQRQQQVAAHVIKLVGGGGGGGGAAEERPASRAVDRVAAARASRPPPGEDEGGSATGSDDGTVERVASGVRLGYALALVAISYAPASHVLLYVAFTVAERTLFLPSAGACLLLAELAASAHTELLAAAAAAAAATRRAAVTVTAASPPREPAGLLAAGEPPPRLKAASDADAAAASTRRGARCCRCSGGGWRALAVPAAVAALGGYYAARTVARSAEWADESALLHSSLAAYPTNNAMSTYGLGALALYEATAHAASAGGDGAWPPERVSARLAQAERWLAAAAASTTLAEPHILLSQLYWRHGYRGDAAAGLEHAERALAVLDNTSLVRKEAWGNLGLLQYHRAAGGRRPPLPGWAQARAEYLVLAAHVAHGYPPSHASIALLANNAGCVRLLSHAGHYGDWQLAARALVEAVTLQETLAGFLRPGGAGGHAGASRAPADHACATAATAAAGGGGGDGAAAGSDGGGACGGADAERGAGDAGGGTRGGDAAAAPTHAITSAVARVFAALPPPDLARGAGFLSLPAVYANAALVAAVAGDWPSVHALTQRGAAVLARSAEAARARAAAAASAASAVPLQPPQPQQPADSYLRSALESLAATALALELHAGTIHRWGARGPDAGAGVGGAELAADSSGGLLTEDPLGGWDGPLSAHAPRAPGARTLAERRLAALGDLPCTMELLWW